MNKDCQPVTLAHRSLTRVTRCLDCGCVTIHIGAFSFRVNDEFFEQIHAAFTEASEQLALVKRGNAWTTRSREIQ